ncbi:MAG: MFS transporter [Clostridiales bacterium]|nr:MFS transporter [Clostridiales bacterium]
MNDPMLGRLVDRTRTKAGKCRPYILWTVVPVMVATSMLFFPVNFEGNGNFIYAIVAYLIYYTCYTALDIPYQGLQPLVFPENETRVRAISISNIVGSIGTILPSVLFFTIAGLWGRDNEAQGYFWTAVIFSVMAGIPIFISYFGIKEKVYIKPEKTNYWKGLKTVFGNGNMRVLTIAAFFTAMVNMGAIFLPYFAKWNMIGVLPMEDITGWIYRTFGMEVELTSEGLMIPLLQIFSGISYMLSMALIPPLLKRFSKKDLWILVSFLGAAANIITFIIGIWIIPYNTPSGTVVYTILRFFTNFPVGMSLVLILSMFSDTVDDLEMKSGERLEGTVFSFRSLVNKLAIALFNVLMLQTVDGFGYDADRMTEITNNVTKPLIESTTVASIIDGVNYTNLLNVIFFMLTALGAIGLICQAIPMFFYKFDEKEQEKKLEAFRKEKEEEAQRKLDEALDANPLDSEA